VEAEREGNMLPLARRLGVGVTFIPELGREINARGDVMALLKLVRLLWRERPLIVHTHTAKAGFLGRLAAWLCGVPLIVHTFHGHVFRGYFGRRKTALFLTLERLLARITDQVLTVNEQQREELLGYRVAPADKIQALHLGLDLEELATRPGDPALMRAKWGVPLEAPLVGIVARLVAIKGHELFLDAAALMHRRRPEVRFVLVGDGERRRELEKYARRAGVAAVFAGWESDLRSVYAALDAVCLTSHNEGSPVALIEALAAGKPVISTAVGGVVDLIEDGVNGLLVRDRSPAAFASCIDWVLDEPAEAQAMGQRGRASVYPEYDVSRLVRDVEALYERLLTKKGLLPLGQADGRSWDFDAG
jgi:glycosyltransferase involved in cell wall biosynthesis